MVHRPVIPTLAGLRPPGSTGSTGRTAAGALGLVALLGSGCATEPTPTWALDPIWIEPVGDDLHGIHTWQLYGEKWHERREERDYVCSVIVELWGAPEEPGASTCAGCERSWIVEAEPLETDCDPSVAEEPILATVQGIGLGGATADPAAPYPGSTYVGYVDYGFGRWETHGWAYPDALDAGTAPTSNEWDGEQPFILWPTLDWPWPPE